jgi:hypothetical protein
VPVTKKLKDLTVADIQSLDVWQPVAASTRINVFRDSNKIPVQRSSLHKRHVELGEGLPYGIEVSNRETLIYGYGHHMQELQKKRDGAMNKWAN